MMFRLMSAAGAALVLLAASAAAEQPPSCKPVERYGVKGCEVLPEKTCPPGYHKKVIHPPNPMMTTPSYVICVPDTPPAKKSKASAVTQPGAN